MSQHDVRLTAHLYDTPTVPLRIEGVIPPDPHYGPGTYEVRLRLSRPMTCFEVQALKPCQHRMYPVRSVLTLYDTTLERVAADADHLAALIAGVEDAGRKLQEKAAQREAEAAAREQQEAARLAALAASITFPRPAR